MLSGQKRSRSLMELGLAPAPIIIPEAVQPAAAEGPVPFTPPAHPRLRVAPPVEAAHAEAKRRVEMPRPVGLPRMAALFPRLGQAAVAAPAPAPRTPDRRTNRTAPPSIKAEYNAAGEARRAAARRLDLGAPHL